jgi:hypothetical protein
VDNELPDFHEEVPTACCDAEELAHLSHRDDQDRWYVGSQAQIGRYRLSPPPRVNLVGAAIIPPLFCLDQPIPLPQVPPLK